VTVGPQRSTAAARQAALLFAVAGTITILQAALSPHLVSRTVTVAGGVVALVLAILLRALPWHRWSPRVLPLVIVPAAFLLIGTIYIYGVQNPLTFTGYFVLTFVWIGLTAPPWTSVVLTPVTAVAFALPLYVHGGIDAQEISATFIVVAVCAVVGEIISHSVRARERLQKDLVHRDQLAAAQRIARLGSWEWDVATGRIDYSDELFRIYGHEPGAFQPAFEGFIKTVHPDDRERVQTIVARALETLEPFSYESRIYRADGELRVFDTHGQVFANEEGEPVRMAGTVQDVTERNAIQEELVRGRDRALRALELAATLESTEDGIVVVDFDGRIQTANRRFAEMWGIPARVFGDGYADSKEILPYIMERIESPEPALARARAVFDSDEETFDTLELKDGRTVEQFSRPQKIDGRIAGRVWSFRDVTEKKQVAAALSAAKTAAEEASLAKGEFLASMSHELRTPLNSVIGFANVLLKNKHGSLQATDLHYLERIRANGQHLLELINDVLDLSKIEVGKMAAEVEQVALGELVEQTVETMRGAVREDGVTLRAVLPGAMAPIATDPRKLKQVLINLLGNALKFTEKGEVTVRVVADPQTQRAVCIEVRDTGVGIPADRIAAIFEAFQQADTGTGRRFGGTGLGLTIAASLCELLGFRLEVESELGVGSTFRLLLQPDPLGAMDPEARGEPAHQPSPGRDDDALGPELRGRLVLVIDDDTDSRTLLTHHLEESGARTITAATGEQGLRMAREFHPDLITLDLLLPGMAGWDILRALKTDRDLRHIPVVIVSMVAHESRRLVVGAAEVVEKPIDRQALIAALRRTLGKEPRRILIVDDEPDARDLLSSYLEDEGAEIRTARDGVEALRLLEDYIPDIVLVDLLMPNMDGVQLIARLNEKEPYRSIPIIVVTSKRLTREEEERLERSTLAVLRKGALLEQELIGALQRIP
jgi:PAS domain S-box-containing protein